MEVEKKWLAEFDKEFMQPNQFPSSLPKDGVLDTKIRLFIYKLLDQQRQEFIGVLEGLKYKSEYEFEHPIRTDQAVKFNAKIDAAIKDLNSRDSREN